MILISILAIYVLLSNAIRYNYYYYPSQNFNRFIYQLFVVIVVLGLISIWCWLTIQLDHLKSYARYILLIFASLIFVNNIIIGQDWPLILFSSIMVYTLGFHRETRNLFLSKRKQPNKR